MDKTMKALIRTLLNAARAQVRQLNVQIEEYEDLLGIDEFNAVVGLSTYEEKQPCCSEAGEGFHLPPCVYYEGG